MAAPICCIYDFLLIHEALDAALRSFLKFRFVEFDG